MYQSFFPAVFINFEDDARVWPLPTCGVICAASQQMELFRESYTKPTLVKLGSLALIKSNATGPSVDGKKYAGNFK